MAPIIEVDEKTMNSIHPNKYVRRADLENKTKQIAELDRGNWIVVPMKQGNKFVKDSYAFDVSPARISYNSAVEKVGKELGINYQNTSKDFLGRRFVGDNNWTNSLTLNLALGNDNLSIKQFNDYLRLLYLGSQGKIKVYNAKGKQIDSKLCEKYFMDVVERKSPVRGEWFDVDFKVEDNQLSIRDNFKLDKNGNLVPQNSEVLDKNTLMKDAYSRKNISLGISLENWLENPTKQGLPTKKTKSGGLYYLYPRSENDSFAGFFVDSSWSILYCHYDQSDGLSYLGIRAAKQRD